MVEPDISEGIIRSLSDNWGEIKEVPSSNLDNSFPEHPEMMSEEDQMKYILYISAIEAGEDAPSSFREFCAALSPAPAPAPAPALDFESWRKTPIEQRTTELQGGNASTLTYVSEVTSSTNRVSPPFLSPPRRRKRSPTLKYSSNPGSAHNSASESNSSSPVGTPVCKTVDHDLRMAIELSKKEFSYDAQERSANSLTDMLQTNLNLGARPKTRKNTGSAETNNNYKTLPENAIPEEEQLRWALQQSDPLQRGSNISPPIPINGRDDSPPRIMTNGGGGGNWQPLDLPQYSSLQSSSSPARPSVQPYDLHQLNNRPNSIYNPNKRPVLPGSPRPIIIDGPNVAFFHGLQKKFSFQGVLICMEYFQKGGHQVTVLLQRVARSKANAADGEIMDMLVSTQNLVFVENVRDTNNRIKSPYDDLFTLKLATEEQAIVVSNDKYRDIPERYPQYADQIRNRVLSFSFSGDIFMVPDDPLGQDGPSLQQFLHF